MRRNVGAGFQADVPDRLGRLDHLAVAAEQQVPVERPGEPAVVGDRDDGTGERRAAPPPAPRPRPGRGCRSARRAAAGSRRTAPAAAPGTGPADRRRACRTAGRPARPARTGRARASRRAGPARCGRRRRATGSRPACGPANSGRSWVCEKWPGTTRAPSRAAPDQRAPAPQWTAGAVARPGRASPAEQPQEVRLAGTVGAQHGDPVAVPDLQVERVGQPVELQLPRSMTARLPVRPPVRFIRMSWSFGGSGGGPASSNLRSLVCADWYREAMSEL